MVQRVTLRQVADYAGVSVTTVSNVIRGWPYISPETRTRVEQAIDAMGYIPHPIAQGLRTGRTHVIGFIVPDLANPHFASMVSTVEAVAREHGYSILLFNTNDSETTEAACIQEAVQRWVDGLLVVQAAGATRTLDILNAIQTPVVAIDRIPPGFSGNVCRVDNADISRIVIHYLYDLGHRHIAHLPGPHGALPAADRLAGYLRALDEYGLDYRRVTASDGTWRSDAGYQAMHELLDNGTLPTAVYASNDAMAIGALHALHERGLRVPEDMSVVGVDDIPICPHLIPALTTVLQPLGVMARAGITMLLDLMNGSSPAQRVQTFVPELVIRQSTAPPAAVRA